MIVRGQRLFDFGLAVHHVTPWPESTRGTFHVHASLRPQASFVGAAALLRLLFGRAVLVQVPAVGFAAGCTLERLSTIHGYDTAGSRVVPEGFVLELTPIARDAGETRKLEEPVEAAGPVGAVVSAPVS